MMNVTDAEYTKLKKDEARLDWLANTNQFIGNVQLPTQCVLEALDMRDAIDLAMAIKFDDIANEALGETK